MHGGNRPPCATSATDIRIVVNNPIVSAHPAEIASAEEPTLSMRGISKHYDAIAALMDVSFDVLPGEVHALLGENGAGSPR